MRRLCSIRPLVPCPVCPGLLLGAVLLAAVGAMQLWGCEHEPAAEATDDQPNTAQASAASDDKDIERSVLHYEIDGMSCTGCAGAIQREIAALDGVERCDVSYKNGSADIEVNDPSLAAAIKESIEDLGYTIVSGPDADDT